MTTNQKLMLEMLTEEVDAFDILEYLFRQQGFKPFRQFLREYPHQEFFEALTTKDNGQ